MRVKPDIRSNIKPILFRWTPELHYEMTSLARKLGITVTDLERQACETILDAGPGGAVIPYTKDQLTPSMKVYAAEKGVYLVNLDEVEADEWENVGTPTLLGSAGKVGEWGMEGAGARSQESEINSQEPGVRSQESEVKSEGVKEDDKPQEVEEEAVICENSGVESMPQDQQAREV